MTKKEIQQTITNPKTKSRKNRRDNASFKNTRKVADKFSVRSQLGIR